MRSQLGGRTNPLLSARATSKDRVRMMSASRGAAAQNGHDYDTHARSGSEREAICHSEADLDGHALMEGQQASREKRDLEFLGSLPILR